MEKRSSQTYSLIEFDNKEFQHFIFKSTWCPTSITMLKNQYFSLLLTIMQLLSLTPPSTMSPEMMLLALMALTETTSQTVSETFGLAECLDHEFLEESWHPVNDKSLEFAGAFLGTNGNDKPFPTCMADKFYMGSMRNAQAAKKFVSEHTRQDLENPPTCDMMMAWVCRLKVLWVNTAKEQKVNFQQQSVDGFSIR